MKDAGFADVRVEPVSHAVTVTTVAAFWRDMERGVAPIALLKRKSSAEEWALIEETAKKNIAEALPSCRSCCRRPPI